MHPSKMCLYSSNDWSAEVTLIANNSLYNIGGVSTSASHIVTAFIMVELVFRCGKDQLRSLVNSRAPLRTKAVANNAQEYNKWTVLVPFNYPQTCSHVTR